MKSILFTKLKKELLDGSKQQTYRCIFIPTYEIDEIVNIVFKDKKGNKEILYPAIITNIYPKQIKKINLKEAIADGFNSVEEFRKKIKEINRVESLNRWGFIIQFKKIYGDLI